jgi:hypothetical protein
MKGFAPSTFGHEKGRRQYSQRPGWAQNHCQNKENSQPGDEILLRFTGTAQPNITEPGRYLRRPDARTLLILAVSLGAGRVLLTVGGWAFGAGWGCVLRTAAASISYSSALVFLVDLSLKDHLP